jgi:hypothetical protein
MRPSIAVLAVALLSAIVIRADEGPSPYAAWSLTWLGEDVGVAGLFVLGTGADTEIYVSGVQSAGYPFSHSWQALRYSAASGQYEQSFASEAYGQRMVSLVPLHTPAPERPVAIVAAFENGSMRIYDPKTKKLLGTYTDPCGARNGLVTVRTFDVTGDGMDEFVSLCGDTSVAVHGFAYTTWILGAFGNIAYGRLTVGQMDNDPAFEIAVMDGRIVDTATHTAQWTLPASVKRLTAADIDNDGRDELLVGEFGGLVRAYDVELQQSKWSFVPPGELGVDALLVTDVDGDGTKELVVGDSQFGKIHGFNLTTRQELWSIVNQQHGVDNLVVANVDNGGDQEILWGAGGDSTGPDRLFIGNWRAQNITWQNTQLDGPFIGPELGDLDGDGKPELVVASFQSNAGPESGHIVVLDGQTLRVRGTYTGFAEGTFGWTGIHDLKLRDINKDGRLDIVVAGDRLYDGLIEAYTFSSTNTFTRVWTNATRPTSEAFFTVDVADVDGNGDLEVIGGAGRTGCCTAGSSVYVYDALTATEEWRTPTLGNSSTRFTGLVVGQLVADARLEIAALIQYGNVYIIDGVTHGVESTLGLTGTTLATQGTTLSPLNPAYGIGSLLVGTASGHVGAYGYDGVNYTERRGWTFGTKEINGVAMTPDGALATASDGAIRILREGATFQTMYYAHGFGRTLLSMGGGRVLFSTGALGVHAFIVRP